MYKRQGEFRVLMNVPLALASCLAPSIVPSLAAAWADKDRRMARQKTGDEMCIRDSACTGSNPRVPVQEEMEKLLKACYYGEDINF